VFRDDCWRDLLASDHNRSDASVQYLVMANTSAKSNDNNIGVLSFRRVTLLKKIMFTNLLT
jgi:hypothetical protein